MFRRLWRYVVALFSGRMDEVENPEVLLSQAQREMQEMHARNRERAAQAIRRKNNLQQMADDTQKRMDNLLAKAELALERGDPELATQMLKERRQYEATRTAIKESLAQAIETAEAVRATIRDEEERIRRLTAETLALKAQWKNLQIQNAADETPGAVTTPKMILALIGLILALVAVITAGFLRLRAGL